jgi:hypothetical protein
MEFVCSFSWRIVDFVWPLRKTGRKIWILTSSSWIFKTVHFCYLNPWDFKLLFDFRPLLQKYPYYIHIFNIYFSATFQSSRSHAIFTLYIQQQRQAKSENNPFHLELDEADSENAVKKVNISCPVLSCHHVHLSVHMYVQMIHLW